MILRHTLRCTLALALVLGVAAVSHSALGEEPPAGDVPVVQGDSSKMLPVTIGLKYTLVSDYVWRGLNLSEYPGEGREKLNHQLDITATTKLKDLGLADFGAVTLGVWTNYYLGYESQNPGPSPGGVPNPAGTTNASNKFMEFDYSVSWEYDIPDTPLTVAAGWIAYNYPHLAGDAHLTFEVFAKVALDDGFIFGQKDPVLSPSLTYYYDYDLVDAGVLVGTIKHKFALDELTEGMPVVRYMTITPSASIILDNRYMDKNSTVVASPGHGAHKSTTLSSVEFGLAVGYDLSKALDMHESSGKLELTVFTNYSRPLAREEFIWLDDVIYGGISLGWEW